MIKQIRYIILKQLNVYSDGKIVYSGKFGQGVNIIHGENGSGKSTILNFIFHLLGGDLKEWKEHALKCDFVMGEFEINGASVVLKRQVAPQKHPPIEFFWGCIKDMDKVGSAAGFQVFPHARTNEKESFSQVLFRILNIPDLTVENSGNVTIHQFLRLLYVDQITPSTNIFRREMFDMPSMRETLGNIVCGVIDIDSMRDQQALKDIVKIVEEKASQVDALESMIGSMFNSSILENVTQNRNKMIGDLQSLEAQLLALSKDRIEPIHPTVGIVSDAIFVESEKLSMEFASAKKRLISIKFEMSDSNQFISSLKHKLEALERSEVARAELGFLDAVICPSCLSEIKESSHEDGICALCKSPSSADKYKANVHKMRQELSNQIAESYRMQEIRMERIVEVEKLIKNLTERIRNMESEQLVNYKVSGKNDKEISSIYENIGLMKSNIRSIDEKMDILVRLDELRTELSMAKKAETSLRSDLYRRSKANQESLSENLNYISGNTKNILRRDLKREDHFVDPGEVLIKFKDDAIFVDGINTFAASSTVFLKNSFFIALWKSAIENFDFLYPRFLLLDNTEDKGMEPARSHNFQRIIVEISKELRLIPHQIIFSTSIPAEELKESRYSVGPYYTSNNKTLAL